MYFSGTKDSLFTSPKAAKIAGSPGFNNSSSDSGLQDGESSDAVGIVAGLVFFYTFVAFLAILSNLFILLTIIKRYVSRNTVNTFLCSLAASDLTMVLLSMFDFAAFLVGEWIFGEAWCKIQSFILEISFTASTLTLVAVSVERYLLICHPYMKRRTINSIYRILFLVWISAFIICTPLLDAYEVTLMKEIDEEVLTCHMNRWEPDYRLGFYAFYSVITYLFPLLIMAFSHWRISLSVKDNNGRRPSASNTLIKEKKPSVCYTIREEQSSTTSTEKSTLDSQETKPSSNGFHKTIFNSISNGLSKRPRAQTAADREWNRREKRLKAIKLLFVVTVTFFALWTPFILMRLLRYAGVNMHEYIYKLSEILIFSSTAVNGFIYAFMSKPFRNAFKALLCCKSRRELVSARDSGPSMSNSEDNRLMTNRSRGSSAVSCNPDSRNGSLSNTKTYSTNGNGELKQHV